MLRVRSWRWAGSHLAAGKAKIVDCDRGPDQPMGAQPFREQCGWFPQYRGTAKRPVRPKTPAWRSWAVEALLGGPKQMPTWRSQVDVGLEGRNSCLRAVEKRYSALRGEDPACWAVDSGRVGLTGPWGVLGETALNPIGVSRHFFVGFLQISGRDFWRGRQL